MFTITEKGLEKNLKKVVAIDNRKFKYGYLLMDDEGFYIAHKKRGEYTSINNKDILCIVDDLINLKQHKYKVSFKE